VARVENENILYSPDEEASGVNTLRGATDEARDYEKKMASGGLSLAQQQLRQGLSSAAQQQAAMGAGGGLSARAGMLAGAQQASQGVGQSAALRAQEERLPIRQLGKPRMRVNKCKPRKLRRNIMLPSWLRTVRRKKPIAHSVWR